MGIQAVSYEMASAEAKQLSDNDLREAERRIRNDREDLHKHLRRQQELLDAMNTRIIAYEDERKYRRDFPRDRRHR